MALTGKLVIKYVDGSESTVSGDIPFVKVNIQYVMARIDEVSMLSYERTEEK